MQDTINIQGYLESGDEKAFDSLLTMIDDHTDIYIAPYVEINRIDNTPFFM